MNGWTQEELDKIEREAAELGSADEMRVHLHIVTGLSHTVCAVWAEEIARRSREPEESDT